GLRGCAARSAACGGEDVGGDRQRYPQVAGASREASHEARSGCKQRGAPIIPCFEGMQMSAIPADLDSGGLAYKRTARFRARPFDPHPLLRNPHLATVAAAYWPRDFASLPPATNRLFEVEPGTRLLAKCHWQERRRSEERRVGKGGGGGSARGQRR